MIAGLFALSFLNINFNQLLLTGHSYESIYQRVLSLFSYTITVPAFQEIPGVAGVLVYSF